MMRHEPKPPTLTYLITPGRTTPETTQRTEEFDALVRLVERAVAAGVSLIQLREKRLPARTLYELASRCRLLTRDTATRLLVNDRADIARAAGCDGVHLTADSLEPHTIRRLFGPDFLVGVSAHTLADARRAADGGADFAVLGPVFDTPSKRAYGPPLGLDAFADAAHALAPFPLLAIGGVTLDNAPDLLHAGARGLAAIRLFAETDDLGAVVRKISRQE